MPELARRPRRASAGRWAVTAVVAVVVLAVGTAAWAVAGGHHPAYRTAAAQRTSVEQTLTATGTLSPVRAADASFQVSGTVAKVEARVGKRVVAGEVLARLDRSSLRTAVGSARAQLSVAREQLSEDQARETEAVAPSRSSSSSTTSTPSTSSGSDTASAAGLARGQRAVLSAQHATDAALPTARTALRVADSACSAQPGSGSTGTAGSTPPAHSTSAPSCAVATSALLRDQRAVSAAENAVERAEVALARLLGATGHTSRTRTTSAATMTSTPRTGSTQIASTTVTAADLATDQATIDQASAQLATARSDLGQATLTAPMSGRVSAVTISKGDSVSAGSSSAPAVEITGTGQDKAIVYLSDTQVRSARVGMPARITPDGSDRSVVGRIVAVGIAGTESSSGTVSYPVTINIAGNRALVAGAEGTVSITIARADNVIAVPTSAVHREGSSTYVELLTDGRAARHAVVIGAVGPGWTEVRSGVTNGQRVVLADLDAAVPTSSNTLPSRAGFRTSGGFGGGGFAPPGGHTGGGGTVTFQGG